MFTTTQVTAISPGRRYEVSVGSEVAVTTSCDPHSLETHRLSGGTLVVCAEIARSEEGQERVRIASPAGWIDACTLTAAASIDRDTMDFATFEDRHRRIARGDHYGIDFPIDLDGLRAAGAEFLTTAFRKAGTIAPDNRVSRIVSLDLLGIPGASENGLLTVAYERDEPGLQTALFVKFPPADVHHKFGLLRLADGEIQFARLTRNRSLPIVTSRSYFEDYSVFTGNFILVTDRVPFGAPPIEPAYRKGYDHLVPAIEEHYDVLARELACLVAAQKRGDMGYDLEDKFPFARAARDFSPIENLEPRLDHLVDFIGRIAPQLFLADVTKPAFLRKWREDVLFGLEQKDAVIAYLLADVDYTGFCHLNLNVDNAWFWREEDGSLRAGLLDWGGAGQASLAQALSGMLMMLEPEKHLDLVSRTIGIFIDELAARGGPRLDREEVHFQYKASLYSTAIFIFVTILADVLKQFPEEYFSSMKSRTDERLLETGLYSAIVWIDNNLREWTTGQTPGDACRQIVAGRHPTPAAPALPDPDGLGGAR